MYIVTVMITAIIFSLTGMGVLQVAQFVQLDSQMAAHFIENKLEVDSYVNIALWRLNAGEDSLANFTTGDVTCSYDTTTLELVVTTVSHGINSSMLVTLEEYYHFKHAIATKGAISMGSYTVGEEIEHEVRDNYEFLPEIDLAYWLSVADTIFADNSRLYHDGDLVEGILIFTGSAPKFDDISLDNTTMVFTAPGVVEFKHTNVIRAVYTDSTIFPALVFTDSTSSFTIDDGAHDQDHIEGAIFSAGTIILAKGELSGPIVAREVTVNNNMDFLDSDYPQYYGWQEGFGSYYDYNWPKQILQWESN